LNPAENGQEVVAEVPLAEVFKYATDLRAMTQAVVPSNGICFGTKMCLAILHKKSSSRPSAMRKRTINAHIKIHEKVADTKTVSSFYFWMSWVGHTRFFQRGFVKQNMDGT
jgi:hypothetical protein